MITLLCCIKWYLDGWNKGMKEFYRKYRIY